MSGCEGNQELVDPGKINCLDHIDMRPAKGYVDAADSSPESSAVNAADDMDNHITTSGNDGNVKVTDIQERLAGNTFECLIICDDASNLEAVVDRSIAVATIPNDTNPVNL